METNTLKRVLAWILLAGFVLLLLNIAIFHVLIVPSVALYLLIAIFFIFSKSRLAREKRNTVVTGGQQAIEQEAEKNKEN
ncbi:hypothetical protein [Ruminiclostridium cellulolyticum]|uniref:Uncharacterized protein n=1 Tax=Ruminiclostridium cellulolyticum (strain ATCC 35319 / DSM 5812 / JCM 6584 / H10) TaxID=394503 RepID=B8I3E0_RUMCH|nr:hypothetical protein [Ruminiclostridium cellulolyticum]ACL76283.1 hypothetical protein Ccel_1935 [Ruminiclostridium cellulolyticum H10]